MLQKHERNGQVRIHLNYDTEAEVFIVTVCDDGVGYQKKSQKNIYARFSTKGINRGFGLNLIHSIVKRHGGFRIFQTNKWRYNRLSRITKKEDQNDDKCPDNRR